VGVETAIGKMVINRRGEDRGKVEGLRKSKKLDGPEKGGGSKGGGTKTNCGDEPYRRRRGAKNWCRKE